LVDTEQGWGCTGFTAMLRWPGTRGSGSTSFRPTLTIADHVRAAPAPQFG